MKREKTGSRRIVGATHYWRTGFIANLDWEAIAGYQFLRLRTGL